MFKVLFRFHTSSINSSESWPFQWLTARFVCFWCSLLLFSVICGWAQWTEPDSTQCPQPGPGAQAPWISNDNLRLYLSSPADIAMFSRASPESPWGSLTILPQHINLTPTQRCPAESPTGDTLYFVGDPRSDCENYGSWDVYFTTRTGECDTCWGPVSNAGANVNSTRREFSVGISRDGSILLVASNRLGSIEADLYWHDRQPDDSWGPANHFGPEINDPNLGEEHPCLSSDNSELYFCHRSVMLGDIWRSQKLNGVWQQASPLPSPPNNWLTVTRDEDPCIASDSRTLWFRQGDRDYNYQIVASFDTTVTSLGGQPQFNTSSQVMLQITSELSGLLRLQIIGAAIQDTRKVVIHDLLGRVIESADAMFTITGPAASSSEFRVHNLPTGIYIISINLSGKTLTAKYSRLN